MQIIFKNFLLKVVLPLNYCQPYLCSCTLFLPFCHALHRDVKNQKGNEHVLYFIIIKKKNLTKKRCFALCNALCRLRTSCTCSILIVFSLYESAVILHRKCLLTKVRICSRFYIIYTTITLINNSVNAVCFILYKS